MIKKLSTCCYRIEKKADEILLIRKTSFSYLCFLTAGIGLTSCIRNNTSISILCFSIIFLLMNIRLIVYYMFYKQYNLQSNECIEYGSVLSFRNPRTLKVVQSD